MTDPFSPGMGGSAARFASGSYVRPASLASRLDDSTSLTNKEKGVDQSFIRHGTLTGGTVCDSTASRVDSCGNFSIRASLGHLRRLGLTREASPPSFSTNEQSDDVLVSDRDTVVPCVACRCALTRPSPSLLAVWKADSARDRARQVRPSSSTTLVSSRLLLEAVRSLFLFERLSGKEGHA